MKPLVAVLHVGRIGAHDVRFFRSPLTGADLPWHSTDDLHVSLSFPRDLRRKFRTMLQRDWAPNVRTVATRGGLTTIAPHPMAQGLISAADDIGCAPYSAEDDYAQAAGEALRVITAGMTPNDAVAYSLAAFKCGGGM